MKDDKRVRVWDRRTHLFQAYSASVSLITNAATLAGTKIVLLDDYYKSVSTPPPPAQWAVWLAMKKWLLDCGYCRVSRRHGVLTRIDREDWLDVCLMHLRHDEENPNINYEDFYRRVLSKDKVDVSKYVSEMIPNSSSMRTGFKPMVEQPTEILQEIVKQAERRAKRRKS